MTSILAPSGVGIWGQPRPGRGQDAVAVIQTFAGGGQRDGFRSPVQGIRAPAAQVGLSKQDIADHISAEGKSEPIASAQPIDIDTAIQMLKTAEESWPEGKVGEDSYNELVADATVLKKIKAAATRRPLTPDEIELVQEIGRKYLEILEEQASGAVADARGIVVEEARPGLEADAAARVIEAKKQGVDDTVEFAITGEHVAAGRARPEDGSQGSQSGQVKLRTR